MKGSERMRLGRKDREGDRSMYGKELMCIYLMCISRQANGSCPCKTNVEGRKCDVCKRGYDNLQQSDVDGCSRKRGD